MAPKKKGTLGGARAGAGRPKRTDIGLEATVAVTARVEKSVVKILKKRHGSIANALRLMAGQ